MRALDTTVTIRMTAKQRQTIEESLEPGDSLGRFIRAAIAQQLRHLGLDAEVTNDA